MKDKIYDLIGRVHCMFTGHDVYWYSSSYEPDFTCKKCGKFLDGLR